MYLVLLLVGLVVAAAGVALLGYAVPVEDFAGAALFISGVVAIVGALTLGAIAAAVRVLSRIAERLEIQPLPLPPVAAVGREDPVPRPVRAVHAAGAAGAAAARPSLLGWLGGGESRVPVRAARAPSPAKPEPEPAAPPPVDLAPLTRIPASSPSSPPSPSSPSSPMANPNGAAATVYRSGVIDGMAYSLFMDGSIEAELPIGRVKFATIDELQQYLEKKK